MVTLTTIADGSSRWFRPTRSSSPSSVDESSEADDDSERADDDAEASDDKTSWKTTRSKDRRAARCRGIAVLARPRSHGSAH